jgi:hypothetical protein
MGKISLKDMVFVGNEGYVKLADGQYVMTIKDAFETHQEDKENRFLDKTNQLQVDMETHDGKPFIAWLNLVGYARVSDVDSAEIKGILDGIDKTVAKKLGIKDYAAFQKQTTAQKMQQIFSHIEADDKATGEEKVLYLTAKQDMTIGDIDYLAGERIHSQERTKVSHNIIGKFLTHAGVIEAGQKFKGSDIDDLKGCEIGIEVATNSRNNPRFVRSMKPSDVEDNF